MDYVAVPVTKFADNCNISRPTMTLLLKGRNEKVSHKLISKIHEAYPQLSVMWLMFGEGDMLAEKNIETSEAQNRSIFDFGTHEIAEPEPVSSSIDFSESYTETPSNNLFSEKEPASNAKIASSTVNDPTDMVKNEQNGTISFNPDQKKQIVNIIVYYDDNSFESFVPGRK